jgi:MFS family permease
VFSAVFVLVSAFAPSLPLFILSYSVLGGWLRALMLVCTPNAGIAFGMVFLPIYIHVSIYFERRRALATGIAVAGCGAGTFAFAPLWSWSTERKSVVCVTHMCSSSRLATGRHPDTASIAHAHLLHIHGAFATVTIYTNCAKSRQSSE